MTIRLSKQPNIWQMPPLREKCPYSKLFWSAFYPIRTEYGELLHIPLYSVWMWGNMEQNNSKYGQFLRSVLVLKCWFWFERKQVHQTGDHPVFPNFWNPCISKTKMANVSPDQDGFDFSIINIFQMVWELELVILK